MIKARVSPEEGEGIRETVGEGVRELAAPVHEQVTVDFAFQLRDRILEVPLEQGRVPLEIAGQGVGPDVLRPISILLRSLELPLSPLYPGDERGYGDSI